MFWLTFQIAKHDILRAQFYPAQEWGSKIATAGSKQAGSLLRGSEHCPHVLNKAPVYSTGLLNSATAKSQGQTQEALCQVSESREGEIGFGGGGLCWSHLFPGLSHLTLYPLSGQEHPTLTPTLSMPA